MHSLCTDFVKLEGSTSDIPLENYLGHCYTNPFRSSNIIEFGLKKHYKVEISIYNIKGQKVKTLVNNVLDAGYHEVTCSRVSSNDRIVTTGIYLYKMTIGDKIITRKLLLF